MVEEEIHPPAPHGASPEGPVGGAGGAFEFDITTDWKQMALETVREHPIPCLATAAILGFVLGRYRGQTLLVAAAGLASRAVLKQINQAFDVQET